MLHVQLLKPPTDEPDFVLKEVTHFVEGDNFSQDHLGSLFKNEGFMCMVTSQNNALVACNPSIKWQIIKYLIHSLELHN